MTNPIVCVNCGQTGHVYRNCGQPITSYGVVCYRVDSAPNEFLIVQRRDSFAYVDFIRGKYDIRDRAYLFRLFENMTTEERRNLVQLPFREIWCMFWNYDKHRVFQRPDYAHAHAQFERLQAGFRLRKRDGGVVCISLASMLRDTGGRHRDTPEWGFPKGRRSVPSEGDLQCAFRELEEETSISQLDVTLVSDRAFEEQYTGNNGVRYRHVYFLARLNPGCHGRIEVCNREIREGRWCCANAVLALMSEHRERCELFRRMMRAVQIAPPHESYLRDTSKNETGVIGLASSAPSSHGDRGGRRNPAVPA